MAQLDRDSTLAGFSTGGASPDIGRPRGLCLPPTELYLDRDLSQPASPAVARAPVQTSPD